ncbi:unnamed protein product [Protopolystoma xenopodis]|uniref:Uncharacterized protein n=1 Tax=Protopolystoma xenopodis TaxID=117903 RepID=A0A3S5FCJ8_9PLAT|nr:unnamed protein product [Protopolystoma xenopodis]
MKRVAEDSRAAAISVSGPRGCQVAIRLGTKFSGQSLRARRRNTLIQLDRHGRQVESQTARLADRGTGESRNPTDVPMYKGQKTSQPTEIQTDRHHTARAGQM